MFQFLTPYHGGTITFRTNKKGRITGVGKIGIHSYPSIDNFLFVEGLKHNVLSKSQLGIMDMLFPLTRMSVSSRKSTKTKGNLYKIKLGELSD